MSKPTPGMAVATNDKSPRIDRIWDMHGKPLATVHLGYRSSDECVANVRLFTAAWNAIQAAAESLGEDPIKLAERLGEGYLVELIRQDEENA